MMLIKLVDARKGLHEKCIELFHDEKVAESIYMYLCDGLEECDVIEPERKTGRWIPCSERLPELDEDGYSDKVLVCFANFTGCEICEYRDCDDCHGWYVGDTDDNPEDIGIHVVAWMPLPEPYKEGEQNED